MEWDTVQSQWHQDALETDREDLIGLLELRFGQVSYDVQAQIEAIQDANALERLILVAANVPEFRTFLEELKESKTAFRIVGSQYQPL